jgi:cullin-associated NEDD8-dissociated protein 1
VTSIVSQIAASGAGDKERALSLQALKEFIVHAHFTDLAASAEALWTPLFSICAVDGPPPVEPSPPATATADEKKKRDQRVDEQWKQTEPIREQWKQTESSRNVAAECLGKITLTQPQRFLPQLQARLQDGQAGIRAAIISGRAVLPLVTWLTTRQRYDTPCPRTQANSMTSWRPALHRSWD